MIAPIIIGLAFAGIAFVAQKDEQKKKAASELSKAEKEAAEAAQQDELAKRRAAELEAAKEAGAAEYRAKADAEELKRLRILSHKESA